MKLKYKVLPDEFSPSPREDDYSLTQLITSGYNFGGRGESWRYLELDLEDLEALARLGDSDRAYRLEGQYEEYRYAAEDYENDMYYQHDRYHEGDYMASLESWYYNSVWEIIRDTLLVLALRVYDQGYIDVRVLGTFENWWDYANTLNALCLIKVADVVQEFGLLNDETKAKALRAALGEIHDLNTWVKGDVWGYRIVDADTGSILDGEWGIYGWDEARDRALRQCREILTRADNRV